MSIISEQQYIISNILTSDIINKTNIDINDIIGVGITNSDNCVLILKQYMYYLHWVYFDKYNNKIHISNINFGIMFGTNINKFNARNNNIKITNVTYIKNNR